MESLGQDTISEQGRAKGDMETGELWPCERHSAPQATVAPVPQVNPPSYMPMSGRGAGQSNY